MGSSVTVRVERSPKVLNCRSDFLTRLVAFAHEHKGANFLRAGGWDPSQSKPEGWTIALRVSEPLPMERSGGGEDLPLPAPTDPGVKVSLHRALLIRRQVRRRGPTSTGRTERVVFRSTRSTTAGTV